MININEVAKKLDISDNLIENYGNFKAKIDYEKIKNEKLGKLILVTSTNPTNTGEGKTTLTIGLNDSLNKLGYKSVAVLREPSLGPVFGSKGGATGGGNAIIEPQNDINLHFNGDFHAITSANNLLCSIIDNHIYQGNKLNIDKVVFKRCLDINDRALRKINLKNREESFVITPASEIMAILCLAKDIYDLKERINNIIVGYTIDNKEIYVKDLECADAIAILLKDALKPNLVQSKYNNPVLVHGGPFANIAHGCNSIIATKLGLILADYVVTEAGFGSDMGALKFLDIKCRLNDIYPDIIVINSTIKSLEYHGNGSLEKGIKNLEFHIDLMKKFNSNVIVSLNKFNNDTEEQINFVREFVTNKECDFVISTMYNDGEDGCLDLANIILNKNKNDISYDIYDLEDPLNIKLKKICNLLGCQKSNYNDSIKEKITYIENSKFNNMPICIAKTPLSITDKKDVLGYPKDFEMTITDISICNGAGFIVIYMGNILTMPGLNEHANYLNMKLENYL